MSWMIDSAHTEVTFHVRHMMITRVRGRFDRIDGSVHFDEAFPSLSAVDVRIATASIFTGDRDRDAHLVSPDFLDADRFPVISFRSKRIEVKQDRRGRIIGDLTIKDVTREVAVDTHYSGQAKARSGTLRAGFTAHTKISRQAWGLTWNVALETGGWLVGDTIDIDIKVTIIHQEAPAVTPNES